MIIVFNLRSASLFDTVFIIGSKSFFIIEKKKNNGNVKTKTRLVAVFKIRSKHLFKVKEKAHPRLLYEIKYPVDKNISGKALIYPSRKT